uniref:Zinc finger protein 507 n=1 Tax=Neogobius melanostomus TaxID=47308 RepID=A0A8C6SSA5_9GOBI
MMEEVSDTAVLVTSSAPQAGHNPHNFPQKQATDSLIQVIQKLSKIVEKRPQRCRTLAGQKRLLYEASSRAGSQEGSGGGLAHGKTRKTCKDEDGARTVTCYQCSLCPYLSPTLSQLREHLKQHNEQHSDLILMCSECRFTSRDQQQLEAHVKLHFDNSAPQIADSTKGEASVELEQKKWYSYEEYGLYRCLICSYVCSQQRMLKTHAWKHAGLVDCTYPIFEEEDGAAVKKEAPTSQPTRSKVPPSAFKLQLCVPLAVEDKQDASPQSESKIATVEEEDDVYPIKDAVTDEPTVDMQVTTDTESHDSASDSLLSSAQKIIHSSPNSAGHINVIVERLPSAGDAVLTPNPLLLSPDEDGEKSILNTPELVNVKEERSDDSSPAECQALADSGASSGVDLPRDENVPPTGRKRTHSESLRLHSLAAEVLVAMPMRTVELSISASKERNSNAQSQAANAGQKLVEEVADGRTGGECPGTKAGISLSLLTVIERLRERSDQNASDEDILKELQDNAQFQNESGGDVAVAVGNGSANYMDGLVTSSDNSLMDYVPGSEKPFRCRLCQYSCGNKGYMKQHLKVHKQRPPNQCPFCEHIASDSKDLESHMIHHCKSKLYPCKQCPESFHYKVSERQETYVNKICFPLLKTEESGLKMYKCDVCDYTSSTYIGVRNHRRIHNSDKPYRCCSCDFATTNMNSLKSHMKKHPQEHQAVQLLEQYRCSLCGYVCSHPPSLKSHMWKHAGDQNYNYEQVNKAINEAISQSNQYQYQSQSQSQGGAEYLTPRGKDPQQPQATEYCLLLFCCCICGFESTSKERLLEHMKEHEGDLISIILNKDQQLAEAHGNLQIAE